MQQISVVHLRQCPPVEKALTMAKGGVPITELARVIWICSDEVPYFDILTAISTSGYTENKNKEEQVDE